MTTKFDVGGGRTTKYDVVTHMGGCMVLGVSHAPKEAGLQRTCSFGGSLLFMRTPFVAELPNLPL